MNSRRIVTGASIGASIMQLPDGTTIDIQGQAVVLRSPVNSSVMHIVCIVAAAVIASLGLSLFQLDWLLIFFVSIIIAYPIWRLLRASYHSALDAGQRRVSVTTANLIGRETQSYPYDSIEALGIEQYVTGYAPALHLKDGRRIALARPVDNYAALETALLPVWSASGLSKADPAAELRATERPSSGPGSAPQAPAQSSEQRDRFERTGDEPIFRVEGATAILESPASGHVVLYTFLAVCAFAGAGITSSTFSQNDGPTYRHLAVAA